MKRPGDLVELGFEAQAIVEGRRWQGPFGALLHRPSLVSVYLRNGTSSCDRQLQQLGEAQAILSRLGCDVLAVSRDSLGSQERYAAKKGLDLALVSDPECRFAEAAGIMAERILYGRRYRGPRRVAYLLRPDGQVLAVIEKVEAADHASQLLAVARDHLL